MLAMTNPSDTTDRLYRLPLAHVAVLQHVAIGQDESDAGVRCHDFQDYVLAATAPEIDPDGYVHHLHALERWCDRVEVWAGLDPARPKWHRRVLRCRAALARLRETGKGKSADVLMVAHGYPDPIVRQIPELAQMREAALASLVRYTDVVERHRAEMIARAAETDLDWVLLRSAQRLVDGWIPPRWGVKASPRPVAAPSVVVDLRAREKREKARTALLGALDATLSSGDALRNALAPYEEPMPVRAEGEPLPAFHARVAERTERRKRAKAVRDAFILEAKQEAMRMLSAAEQRYYEAWTGVGWP